MIKGNVIKERCDKGECNHIGELHRDKKTEEGQHLRFAICDITSGVRIGEKKTKAGLTRRLAIVISHRRNSIAETNRGGRSILVIATCDIASEGVKMH